VLCRIWGFHGSDYEQCSLRGVITLSYTPWPWSASELNRLRSRRLSAKLVPTFADRGCHVVSVTDSHGCILGFLDRSRYYFFQVAPQLYSRGWVDPVPDPLRLRKSGSAGKPGTLTTRHRGGPSGCYRSCKNRPGLDHSPLSRCVHSTSPYPPPPVLIQCSFEL
jgi:hypothetical protein